LTKHLHLNTSTNSMSSTPA